MKYVFIILGFGFLGASLFMVPKAEEDMHVFDLEWTCRVNDSGDQVCSTNGAPDITVQTMTYVLWMAAMGIACMAAAVAVGLRGPRPPAQMPQPGMAGPVGPGGPSPMPPPQPFMPPNQPPRH